MLSISVMTTDAGKEVEALRLRHLLLEEGEREGRRQKEDECLGVGVGEREGEQERKSRSVGDGRGWSEHWSWGQDRKKELTGSGEMQ